MVTKAEQKEKTRRAILDAALKLLSADRSFSSLTLREVAREANIAPTSFYRHFHELEDLGLALVDESGLALRQLLRQARKLILAKGGVIRSSVETFMEYLEKNPNHFRLIIREKAGGSQRYRAAIKSEVDHFISELENDLVLISRQQNKLIANSRLVAEACVTIVFNLGGQALDIPKNKRPELAENIMLQLRMVMAGAQLLAGKK